MLIWLVKTKWLKTYSFQVPFSRHAMSINYTFIVLKNITFFNVCVHIYSLVRGYYSAVWIYLPVLYVFSCHRCTQGVIWSYLCLQTRHGPSSYSDPPRNGRSSHLPTINTRSGIAHSEFDNVIFNVTCEEFNTIYSFTMSLVNRDNIRNNQRRSLYLKYE